MIDWELTATTIYCEDIDDEVTIIVSQDGTVKCTGAQKYASVNKQAVQELKKKSQQKDRILLCKDTTCSKITKYRDELLKKK
jgi:hypothetical protein